MAKRSRKRRAYKGACNAVLSRARKAGESPRTSMKKYWACRKGR